MKRWLLLAALTATMVAGGATGAAPRLDYAGVAYDILVPGENGGVQFNANTNDQEKLYDALTPLFDKVTAAISRSTSSRTASRRRAVARACPATT